MPDKKVELQVTLEAILDKKKGKHGNLFQIKIKHYKPMWVSDQKVSKEAVAAYLSGSRGVPKNSYVVLARRYAKPPVDTKMKSIHSFFGKPHCERKHAILQAAKTRVFKLVCCRSTHFFLSEVGKGDNAFQRQRVALVEVVDLHRN